MLTLHTAELVLPAEGPPLPNGAVLVEGPRIVAVGPGPELTGRNPTARVRRWPGLLVPGLLNRRAAALLEEAYHPDPREADRLGTAPLTGADLAALEMTETRWSASARRGLQAMLRYGTTALIGPFGRPAVRTAVARSGLRVLPGARVPGPPSLDPTVGEPDRPGAEAVPLGGALAAGAPADFAVFALRGAGEGARAGASDTDSPGEPLATVADPLAALGRAGAGTCLATVLGGRLLHRRR
ncbi:amidohydrolase family protein [Streptomyces sp. TP-A0874]|uniref:amidohydrolase family protein n=1 Tax=Streptomyces sp. TP-A0874 TaxID=549819 RepID=UPI0008539B2D|nr:hypothetical protein [Streptomyces sp. TP-A0874]